MKIATIIIRTILGLLFLYTSISYFLHLSPEPVSTGDFKAFQLGLVASMYLLPLAKGVELLCGLAFVTGKFTTLANLVILPVTLNILLINYFLTPENLPLAIFVFAGNIFLIFTHWENYKGLFKMD
ncbi:DoxX family membrane protein [Flavobacterium hiemivividum]|uniref:DoxX family membrane protein n=1 Tax=Flavobacterium hiemivividum TaxID=2541734 RepID=A0A4R5CTA6_9FLAO|nr:DoxX family membrane protein [Flavobacterium hiemivividum]TDE03536.1 DoxX family membrane protein [Flavobacterium hiemivividum]